MFAGYAIDDQTAIKVVDDTVEVISEGHSKLFERKEASHAQETHAPVCAVFGSVPQR